MLGAAALVLISFTPCQVKGTGEAEEIFEKIEKSLLGVRTLRVRVGYASKGGTEARGDLLLGKGNRARAFVRVTKGPRKVTFESISDGTRQRSLGSGMATNERPASPALKVQLMRSFLRVGHVQGMFLSVTIRTVPGIERYVVRDLATADDDTGAPTLRYKVLLHGQRQHLEVELWYDPETLELKKRTLALVDGHKRAEASESYNLFEVNGDIPNTEFELPKLGPFVSRTLGEIPTEITGSRSLVFSADGKTSAIAVKSGKTGKAHLFLNSQLGPAFDNVADPVLSPDGQTVAYMASTGTENFVVVGKKPDRAFDKVTRPYVSPDGKIVAYRAHIGESEVMVVGGVPGDPYDDVHTPYFSPRSNVVAYAAEKGGKGYIVVGKTPVGSHDECWWPIWNPDGKTVSYGAKDGDEQFMMIGGSKGKAYDRVGQIAWSPDGKEYAYEASRDGKSFIVVGDEERTPYDNVLFPSFGPKGKLLTYSVQKGEKYFVVIGEREIGPYDQLVPGAFGRDGHWDREPVLSKDGTRFAFRAKRGTHWFVVSGRTDQEEISEGDPYQAVGRPVLSADGSHLAYAAAAGRAHFVVLNGQRSPPHDHLGPILFSPDGKLFAHGGKQKQFIFWKVTRLEK